MIPKKFSTKMYQRKYTSQIINKRKSDDISNINFINKLSNINNNKISKIPVHFRYSCQNENTFLKNKFLNRENKDCNDNNNINNNEISTKKDKNYYLNLLNDIYLNDSHLSNNNNETYNKVSKKMMKKKTCNFSKLKIFKNNQIIKSSKNLQKLSLKFNNNGSKNKSNEKNNNKNDRDKKENQNFKRFSSDICLFEFKSTEALVKLKKRESFKKKRNPKFNIDEDKHINKNLNEHLEHKESSKLNKINIKNKENKQEKNKRSRNNENQFENEMAILEKTNTKNISNSNNLKDKSNTKKKYKKMYKTCFCCLIKNSDDSL